MTMTTTESADVLTMKSPRGRMVILTVKWFENAHNEHIEFSVAVSTN